MEFKIDTKSSFTIITPNTATLDANLTEAIRQKWKELTESGSNNLVVDLTACIDADDTAYNQLVHLHQDFYNSQQSLVFINMSNNIIQDLKNKEIDQLLNIAPTLIEATDIISMEILERDLFNEE